MDECKPLVAGGHTRSPLTNTEMSNLTLTPNHSFRKGIERALELAVAEAAAEKAGAEAGAGARGSGGAGEASPPQSTRSRKRRHGE